jgi:tRNA G18 (ribose-2'-O)-methylase SpoU
VDDRLLRPFQHLKERDLRREGIFVAEGRLLVERLLASGWEVLSVLSTPRFAAHFRRLASGRCPVVVAAQEQVAAIAGFPFHRGVLAAGPRPPLGELERFLEAEARGPGGGPSMLLACPALTGAENLGAVLRSAAAFGVGGVLLGPRCCDPLSRRALKASMGAVFRLPLVELREERRAVALLEAAGFELVGASLAPAALPLADYRRGRVENRRKGALRKVVLVLGEEASGIPEPWRSGCDRVLTIPMAPGTDSLNVAVAAGIFLYCLQEPTLQAEGHEAGTSG